METEIETAKRLKDILRKRRNKKIYCEFITAMSALCAACFIISVLCFVHYLLHDPMYVLIFVVTNVIFGYASLRLFTLGVYLDLDLDK